MALLANVLAVALSGLFFEDILAVPHPLKLGQPYKPTLANGTVKYIDQYYLASSNTTSGTVLPPWTDSKYFYLPFSLDAATNASYKASTRAFGARLKCSTLTPATVDNSTVTLDAGNGTTIECTANIPLFNVQHYTDCSGVPWAAENLGRLVETGFSFQNDTNDGRDFCQQWIVASWSRNPGDGLCATNDTVGPADTIVMACRPELVTEMAEVVVDPTGYIQAANHSPSDAVRTRDYFDYNQSSLVSQINKNFVDQAIGVQTGKWHNDSFPSDYVNYLMVKLSGSDRILDPSSPVPQVNETAPLLSEVYARMFAINLGYNIARLLQPLDDPQASAVPGFVIRRETRIFLSKPMFWIAVAILSTYIVASVIVHIRRPGRFLPRFPTTIASVIAFFAASHAVLDLKGTAHMSKKERDQYVAKLDRRYGYQSFIGTDGKVHVGMERQPYLGLKRRNGVNGPQSIKKGVRLSTFGWRDGKLGEGGWI